MCDCARVQVVEAGCYYRQSAMQLAGSHSHFGLELSGLSLGLQTRLSPCRALDVRLLGLWHDLFLSQCRSVAVPATRRGFQPGPRGLCERPGGRRMGPARGLRPVPSGSAGFAASSSQRPSHSQLHSDSVRGRAGNFNKRGPPSWALSESGSRTAGRLPAFPRGPEGQDARGPAKWCLAALPSLGRQLFLFLMPFLFLCSKVVDKDSHSVEEGVSHYDVPACAADS